jgi:hypothetical protein
MKRPGALHGMGRRRFGAVAIVPGARLLDPAEVRLEAERRGQREDFRALEGMKLADSLRGSNRSLRAHFRQQNHLRRFFQHTLPPVDRGRPGETRDTGRQAFFHQRSGNLDSDNIAGDRRDQDRHTRRERRSRRSTDGRRPDRRWAARRQGRKRRGHRGFDGRTTEASRSKVRPRSFALCRVVPPVRRVRPSVRTNANAPARKGAGASARSATVAETLRPDRLSSARTRRRRSRRANRLPRAGARA